MNSLLIRNALSRALVWKSFRQSYCTLSLVCRQQHVFCNDARKRDNNNLRTFSSEKNDSTEGEQDSELSFDEELKQLSILQRYKKLVKEYWYVLIPVHCCTSIFWFGSCLAIVYTGVEIDLVYIAETLHFPEGLVKPLRNPNLGKLAVALMLYKLVSPFRYMSTVYAAVPSIKILVRRGMIKPVPRLTSRTKIEEELRKIRNKMTKKRGED